MLTESDVSYNYSSSENQRFWSEIVWKLFLLNFVFILRLRWSTNVQRKKNFCFALTTTFLSRKVVSTKDIFGLFFVNIRIDQDLHLATKIYSQCLNSERVWRWKWCDRFCFDRKWWSSINVDVDSMKVWIIELNSSIETMDGRSFVRSDALQNSFFI